MAEVTEEIASLRASAEQLGEVLPSASAGSIGAVVRLNTLLGRISQDGSVMQAEYLPRLRVRAVAMGLGEECSDQADRLQVLSRLAGGDAIEDCSLGDLVSRIRRWIADHDRLLAGIAEGERRLGLTASLRVSLARLHELFDIRALAAVRARCAGPLADAALRLEEGDLEGAENLLSALLAEWDQLRAPGGLAARYRGQRALRLEPLPEGSRPSSRLVAIVEEVARWLEAWDPGDLGTADLGPTRPLGEFEQLLESDLVMQLAPQRVSAVGPGKALEELLGVLRPRLKEGPATPAAEEALVAVLARAAAESGALAALSRVLDCRLGADAEARICEGTLERIAADDPYWLPPAASNDGEQRALEMLARHAPEARLPPRAALRLMMIRCHGDGRAPLEQRLLDLGVFGSWLCAALVPEIDAVSLESFSWQDDAAVAAALPAALAPKSADTTARVRPLLAALELVASRAGRRIGFDATWRLVEHEDRCPGLIRALKHAALSSSAASAAATNATSPSEAIELAKAEAGHVVRPRNYRGVNSAQTLSREFVDRTADPLLKRALAARSAAEQSAVRADVLDARDQLGRRLAQRYADFPNPPDGKLRIALESDCEAMLDAVERLLDALMLERGAEFTREHAHGLADELGALRRRGGAWVAAADLFQRCLVDHRDPKIPLPGDLNDLRPESWDLPACRALWVTGCMRLDEYARAITEDLADDPSGLPAPARWIVDRARDGDLALAEERLRSLRGAHRSKVVEELSKERGGWELIVSERVETLLRERDMEDEVRSAVARASRDAKDGRYGAAYELLDEIGRKLDEKRAAARATTAALDERLEQLRGAAWRCPEAPVRRAATVRLLDLQDRMAGMDTAEIERQLAEIAVLLVEPAPGVPTMAAEPAANPPEEPAPALLYGIVRVSNAKYAFLRPIDVAASEVHVDRALLPKGDDDLLIGTLVAYGDLRQVPGQPRLSAKSVEVLNEGGLRLAQKALRELHGERRDGVGIVLVVGGRRRIATDDDGAYLEADSRVAVRTGQLVHYEVFDRERRLARAIATAAEEEIAPGRRQLIQTAFVAKPDAVVRQKLGVGDVDKLSPGDPSAIGDARSVLDDANADSRHHDVVVYVERKLQTVPTEGNWLRAMLVEAYLTAPPPGTTSENVLEALYQTRSDWLRGNADASLAQVYSGLRDFGKRHPKGIAGSQLREFFRRLQAAQEHNPLFRIEIVLARLSSVDMVDGNEAPDLSLALHHARRARVVNPRAAEGAALEKQLVDLLVAAGAVEHHPTANESGPSHELPEEPVAAQDRVQRFYRERKASEIKQAIDFFEKHRHGASGLALNELITRHTRLLLDASRASEAEQILLRHARQGEDVWWSALLERLFEAWEALGVSSDRLALSVSSLRVPEPWEYLVSLLQAKAAFNMGRMTPGQAGQEHYEAARELAIRSLQQAPNADARQILERSEAMLGKPSEATRGTARPSELSVEQRRSAALETVRRAAEAYRDSPLRVVDVVCGHMADADVGPWLVRELVNREGETFGIDLDGDILVMNARQHLQAPSALLLEAEMAARWSQEDAYKAEQSGRSALQAEIEALLDGPSDDKLSAAEQRLGNWTAFALMDVLSRELPDNAAIRWHRALCAREVRRTADYVEGALRCMDERPAEVAAIASSLRSLKLPGLAIAVASQATQGQQIVEVAQQECQVEPVNAPILLHKARDEDAQGHWPEAMDLLVRALLNQPDSWAVCRAFVEAFTQRSQDDPRLALILVRVGAAAARHVAARHRGIAEPITLEAELRFEESKLAQACSEPQKEVDGHRGRALDLCDEALRQRTGFMPAVKLRQRVRDWGEDGGGVLAPGEVFNGYRIETILGSGSFGHVYQAVRLDDPATVVAIKVLRDDGSPERRAEKVRSLDREARILLKLQHKNIVRTIDVIANRCLVLEFVAGRTVSERLAQGVQLPWRSVARLGHQVVEALRHADTVSRQDCEARGEQRQRTFAHRDIHPGNIMICETPGGPEAKVLDFGLARLPGATFSTVQFSHINDRTHYRDPTYGPEMDFRGDMFSLGVILYELLCGEPPYPKEEYADFRFGALAGSEIAKKLRTPSDLAPPGTEIPEKLSEILARMVRFRPSDRFRSLDILADELLRLTKEGQEP